MRSAESERRLLVAGAGNAVAVTPAASRQDKIATE